MFNKWKFLCLNKSKLGIKMKIIMILLLPIVLFAGNSDLQIIKELIDKGNFSKTTILIDTYDY
jgi:hypothetical protein